MARALIFGIGGQDASYLAEILLERGYEVHGTLRHSSGDNTWRIAGIADRLHLHSADLADDASCSRVIAEVQPDEIYNEADMDHVGWSFKTVGYSLDITGAAVGRLLEATRKYAPEAKFFQPLSSHMFGMAKESPQNESTELAPTSPYSCAKALAFFLCQYYRRDRGLHVSTAIFYNHESPRRNQEYFTRKVVQAAALGQPVTLQTLNGSVDWGYAHDYMEAAVAINTYQQPDDFVVGTGITTTLFDFCRRAYKHAGIAGDEVYDYIKVVGPKRPATTSNLCAAATKIRNALGWRPKTDINDLIKIMYDAELARIHNT